MRKVGGGVWNGKCVASASTKCECFQAISSYSLKLSKELCKHGFFEHWLISNRVFKRSFYNFPKIMHLYVVQIRHHSPQKVNHKIRTDSYCGKSKVYLKFINNEWWKQWHSQPANFVLLCKSLYTKFLHIHGMKSLSYKNIKLRGFHLREK